MERRKKECIVSVDENDDPNRMRFEVRRGA